MPLPKPSQLRYFEPAQLNHKWRYVVRDLRKMEYDSRVKLAKTLEKEVENVE